MHGLQHRRLHTGEGMHTPVLGVLSSRTRAAGEATAQAHQLHSSACMTSMSTACWLHRATHLQGRYPVRRQERVTLQPKRIGCAVCTLQERLQLGVLRRCLVGVLTPCWRLLAPFG